MASAEVLSRHRGEVIEGFRATGVYAAVCTKVENGFGAGSKWFTYRFEDLESFAAFIAETWEEVYTFRIFDIAEFTDAMYRNLNSDIQHIRKGGSDV